MCTTATAALIPTIPTRNSNPLVILITFNLKYVCPFVAQRREGSHTDNDANDPWINTVTSIESIVARSGYPSSSSSFSSSSSTDRDGTKSSSSFEQFSRSPPSSSSSATAAAAAGSKSPQNGGSSSPPSAATTVTTASAAAVEISRSPPRDSSYLGSPLRQPDNKRLQPSPSRAGDVSSSGRDRRSMVDEIPERDHQQSKENERERDRDRDRNRDRERDRDRERERDRDGRREKPHAPSAPGHHGHHHTKDSNWQHHQNDEPDTPPPSSKPSRSSSSNHHHSRPKNVVPTIVVPLISDVNPYFHSS